MSLKKKIDPLHAIKAAGFKLVNSKSIPTDDGACWEATLAFGTQKLVRAFDGGFGGEVEIEILETPKLPLDAIRSLLATFIALPAVQSLLKDCLIEIEAYSLEFKSITQSQFDANRAKILAEDVALDNHAIELAIKLLAYSHESIAPIKRKLKTCICFTLAGDDAKGQWRSAKALDTPANRETLRKRHNVDYFLADVVAGL